MARFTRALFLLTGASAGWFHKHPDQVPGSNDGPQDLFPDMNLFPGIHQVPELTDLHGPVVVMQERLFLSPLSMELPPGAVPLMSVPKGSKVFVSNRPFKLRGAHTGGRGHQDVRVADMMLNEDFAWSRNVKLEESVLDQINDDPENKTPVSGNATESPFVRVLDKLTEALLCVCENVVKTKAEPISSGGNSSNVCAEKYCKMAAYDPETNCGTTSFTSPNQMETCVVESASFKDMCYIQLPSVTSQEDIFDYLKVLAKCFHHGNSTHSLDMVVVEDPTSGQPISYSINGMGKKNVIPGVPKLSDAMEALKEPTKVEIPEVAEKSGGQAGSGVESGSVESLPSKIVE